MTLFSYCITADNGSAPNPFWDICTLAICKPVIRRTAQVGDWIVGTGSKAHGFGKKVIYAMEVTDKKTFAAYDQYCIHHLPGKIPDLSHHDLRRRAGDCIYQYGTLPTPTMRPGIHTEVNRDRDLRGQFVLLSTRYFYFGSTPVDLPAELEGIVRQGQGHKSKSNEPYRQVFIDWISKLDKSKTETLTSPKEIEQLCKSDYLSVCSHQDKNNDDEDEEIGVVAC